MTNSLPAKAEKEVEDFFRKPKIDSKNEQGIYRYRWPVPKIRKQVKAGFSFSGLSDAVQFKIWNHIWRTTFCYESMSSCLYYCQSRPLQPAEIKTILGWVSRCTCWEHSDDLSKIYATIVETDPNRIIPTLKQWNKSRNPWKRRQSVVSLLEYTSKRKRVRPFQEMIQLVKNLLKDKDYYVQKGVGWTIREIYNAYPKETYGFLKENIHIIDPKAFSAATEKLPTSQKDALKIERKRRHNGTL